MKAALQRAASTASTEAVPILIVGLFAAAIAAGLAQFFTTDTWLALVAGREIVDGGLPRTDTLTVWSAGERWVDQQWLGQLALYGLHALGGLELVAAVHALLVVAPFAAALAFARRRGASVRNTALVGALAIEPCLVVAANIRTQSFAFGLFVALVWLLSSDSREPSRRVFWTIPILVLWSNLHGSVVLGVALVVLAGALSLYEALRGRGSPDRPARRSALLIGLAIAAVFVSPYATELPSYYEATLLNPHFRTLVSEWRSPELSLIWAPFFVLAGAALVVLGRAGARLTAFERTAIVATAVLALTAYRNLAWFGLAAAMLLPAAIGSARTGGAPPSWLAATVSALLAGAILVIGCVSLAGLDERLRERLSPRMLDVVAQAAARDPGLDVYADLNYADWLLWQRPQLAGRLLFDARLELLSSAELRRIVRFQRQLGAGWRGAAGTARLFVLDARQRPLGALPATWSVLLRSPRARRLHRDSEAVVVLSETSPPVRR